MVTAFWERKDGTGSPRKVRAQHCTAHEAGGEVREMLLFTVKGRTNEVTG